MRLVAVTILALQPLVMAGVANVEFGPDFPKSRTLTSSATPSTVSANTASLTSSPNPVIDCTDVSKSIDPSCWDTLGMAGWLVRWNATTQTCNQTEIWSICFLREAYGTPGCDCSKLGSVSCVAPQLGAVPHDAHIFYAAYNIYAMEQYFSAWQTALYAINSQPAINNLAEILSGAGEPLRVGALLAAIVTNFGLDPVVDEAFVNIMPSGKKSPLLDMSAQYKSTQLGAFLAAMLLDMSTNFLGGYFTWMATDGQLMRYAGESLHNLEANLANVVPSTEAASTEELGPVVN